MSLVSFSFAIFLICSLISYYIIPRKFQWIVLLAASTFFYFCAGIGNFAFIIFSSLTTFFAAKLAAKFNHRLTEKKQVLSKEEFKAEKHRVQQKKRIVLSVLLTLNVGILFFLKYINVLFIHKTFLLPLGISYYTLQLIAYFMDVYNSKCEAENNFLRFFSFVSFFPQLIMGPINRYPQLGKQMKEEHSFDFSNMKHGVMLILYGAMKKYVIADLLYQRVVAVLDNSPLNIPGILIVFGVLMYAVYQYADFSGGIDMVLGIAELFGLKMQENFKQPYFSTSLANFWQRWHISLGSWMRDYVFYPFAFTKFMQNLSKWCASHLGKHFAKVLPSGIANILVFMLVGLWHGPEIHFFVWGLYNGIVIALSDFLSPAFNRLNEILHINAKSRGMHIFRIVRTFIIVNIGWYFDHIVDVKRAFIYLKNTILHFGSVSTLMNRQYLIQIFGHISNFESQIVLVIIGSAIVFAVSLLKENKVDVYEKIQEKNIVLRWMSYYVLMALIILSFSFTSGETGFMYAQY